MNTDQERCRIIVGDARTALDGLADGCARCCVTSPPYWGLRDYGVAGQIGLEATPEEWCTDLVRVFAAVRRVLADDGTLWVNCGDTYAATAGQATRGGPPSDSSTLEGNGHRGGGPKLAALARVPRGTVGGPGWGMPVDADLDETHSRRRKGTDCDPKRGRAAPGQPMREGVAGLKPKDLIGLPWMLAFALRADGWYLRSDIIWHKPNPMPESVQGSHFSRHMVTIEDYERLSGLQYVDERAGSDWAGNMPRLSEREVFSSQAPLSAKRQGQGNGAGARRAPRRAGEAKAVQPIATGEDQPEEVRGDQQGEGHARAVAEKVSKQPARSGGERPATQADKGHPGSKIAEANGQCEVQTVGERQGTFSTAECEEKGVDRHNREPLDGGGVAGNREGAQVPMFLLQEENEVDSGSCDPAEQGRQTHQDERDHGVRVVQLEEEGQDSDPVLVGCPGCSLCIKHHGYLFHMSAGRPTKSHEYIFLLSKGPRYFYDAAALYEPCSPNTNMRVSQDVANQIGSDRGHAGGKTNGNMKAVVRAVPGAKARSIDAGNHKGPRPKQNDSFAAACALPVTERNARTVWTIPTQGYSGAHFATFPRELAARCIKAGSAVGDLVLDPFLGTGTTIGEALMLGRRGVGVELNPEYAKLAEKRIADTCPLFSR